MKDSFTQDTRCAIYSGVLGDGSFSPGFIPAYGSSKHPAAWVCSLSALKHRAMQRELPNELSITEEEWAEANVRLVYVEFHGSKYHLEPAKHDIIVFGPFHQATRGRPAVKLGFMIEMSVTDGETDSDRQRRSLTDRKNLSVKDRISSANARYIGGLVGNQTGLREIQTPSPGHIWWSI